MQDRPSLRYCPAQYQSPLREESILRETGRGKRDLLAVVTVSAAVAHVDLQSLHVPEKRILISTSMFEQTE